MKNWHILILVASVVALDCTSKTTAQIPVALPINLQLGISLDSAERLLKMGGWVWDSLDIDNSKNGRIRFRELHFSQIDEPLSGMLIFRSGILQSFLLSNSSFLNTHPSSTLEDYRHLVSNEKSVYGTPSDSGIRGSTTYTNWVVHKDNGLVAYMVQFSSNGSSLMFSGAYARFLFPFDTTKYSH